MWNLCRAVFASDGRWIWSTHSYFHSVGTLLKSSHVNRSKLWLHSQFCRFSVHFCRTITNAESLKVTITKIFDFPLSESDLTGDPTPTVSVHYRKSRVLVWHSLYFNCPTWPKHSETFTSTETRWPTLERCLNHSSQSAYFKASINFETPLNYVACINHRVHCSFSFAVYFLASSYELNFPYFLFLYLLWHSVTFRHYNITPHVFYHVNSFISVKK